MREIRQSGLEGGVALTGHPYPYSIETAPFPISYLFFSGAARQTLGFDQTRIAPRR